MKHKTKPKTLLRFRRWSKKKYSIFNTIGKTVTIGTLATMMLSNGGHQVFGQTGNTPIFTSDSIIHMNEVQVEGAKVELLIPLIDAITVISAQDIQRAGVQNLQDLLQFVKGLDIKTRGNEGVQADISYRGSTFDQIAILINGINFTDPQTGHHNLNIPIIFSEIERIEILKGPGAWSSGNIAFSGAINIVYKEKKTQTQLKMVLGEHYYALGEISTHFVKNKFHIMAGINHNLSTGYTDNTDFNITNFYTFGSYRDPKIGNINFQLGFSGKDFGANSFYSIKYKEQYEETRALIGSIQYDRHWKSWRTSLSIYYRQHHDRFQLFRSDAPVWYTGDNYHLTNVLGGSIQLSKITKWGITTISVDGRSESIFSTNLGELLPISRWDPYAGDSLFSKGKNRTHFSISVTHKKVYRKWLLSLGIMESGNNDYGFRTYLGGNVEFKPFKNSKLSFYLNNSYRLPTFTDLYYSSPSQIGNPDLKPEQSINSELSYSQIVQSFTFETGIFYKYGFQLIDWVKLPSEEKWHSENLQNITTWGIDGSIIYLPKRGFIKKIVLNYTYLNISTIESNYQSMYVTDYLKHQINLQISHSIYKGFSADWSFSYNDRNGNFIDKITLKELPYPNVLISNLKLDYSQNNYRIFLEINNLFNVIYFDYPNLIAPGRWIKVGIGIKL
jgi:vitamin B12 transporter